MNQPHLAPGQDVTYVTSDGKTVKAKITQVFGLDDARVEWDDGKHAAITQFNAKKQPGTFHFAEASAKLETPTEAKK